MGRINGMGGVPLNAETNLQKDDVGISHKVTKGWNLLRWVRRERGDGGMSPRGRFHWTGLWN